MSWRAERGIERVRERTERKGEGKREEVPWNLGAGVSEAQVQASLKTLL